MARPCWSGSPEHFRVRMSGQLRVDGHALGMSGGDGVVGSVVEARLFEGGFVAHPQTEAVEVVDDADLDGEQAGVTPGVVFVLPEVLAGLRAVLADLVADEGLEFGCVLVERCQKVLFVVEPFVVDERFHYQNVTFGHHARQSIPVETEHSDASVGVGLGRWCRPWVDCTELAHHLAISAEQVDAHVAVVQERQ